MLARRILITLAVFIAIGALAIAYPLVFNVLLILVLIALGISAWGLAVLMTLDSWRAEKIQWRR